MRRLSLSTKLFAAALPLVLAVGALLALTVRNDLRTVDDAERGAELGAVWDPLVATLTSVEAELDDVDTAATASTDPAQLAAITATRRATDQSMNALNESIADLGAAEAARKHITQSRSAMSSARRAIDLAGMAPEMAAEVDLIDTYDIALRELVSIGQLLPAESGDPELGRELLAVVKLAEGRVAADAVIANVEDWQLNPVDPEPLATARVRFAELESVLNEFAAVAPEEWAKQYRQSGLSMSLAQYRAQLDSAQRAAESGEVGTFDLEGFAALSNQSLAMQQEITSSIVERSSAKAAEIQKSTLVRTAIALAAVLVAALIAWLLTRSVTRRVKAISTSANQVATEQLPTLVEALRDPRGKSILPTIAPVDDRGGDELAELASAFNSMQSTLVDVAHEQVEVLRRGVSDIFVTMARRNRSLIDRQLAMLDEFEAEVDDPDVLSHYYQLDHMATRMRRNSESLLVLANAEPKRRRVKATEIDDVVRAAIGEVEDYRRIDVETLESLQVRGNVVADISHLLAELLDNATSFSPPDSSVRVGGRRAGDSYMLRIVDNGVGIGVERLRELNELLREPPIVGLSVEPTLGMSVVSLLANRHGVSVTLSQGSPGTTVDVLLPSSLFGPIDVPAAGTPAPVAAPPDVAGPLTTVGIDPLLVGVAADIEAQQFAEFERQIEAVPEYGRDVAPAVAISGDDITVDLADIDADITDADTTESPTVLVDDGPTADAPSPSPSPSPSWTTMSLDLASLRATPSQPAQPDLVDIEPAEQFVPVRSDGDADPTADLDRVDLGDLYEDIDVLPVDELSDGHGTTEVPGEPFLLAPRTNPLPTRSAAPALPPPLPAPVASGEFDRPLAPPVTAESISRRPVAPADALPASTVKLADPLADPELPTRSPGRGPDGPDRLAAVTPDSAVAPTSSPSALQAALTAFDARRNGNDALPTRERSAEGVVPASFDQPPSTAQSRLDPEALRERLRAFQTEFRTASDGAQNHETIHMPTSPTNADLGGDRR